MKSKTKNKYNLTCIAIALSLSMSNIFSQEESKDDKNKKDDLMNVITITAQKRESNIQKTPISVTALSGEVMDQIGIDNLEDFQFFTPGITITNDSMAIVNIRGIGTSAFGVATDPSSTVYIDGIYQPRPTTGYQDMFDIERVELLRGPQGVLFGRNSAGGTLNIISKAPTEDFEGAIGLTYGSFNKKTFTGTFSGALSENTRARFTLLRNKRDGIYKDILSGNKYQNENTLAARATIAIDLSDKFELVLRGDFNKDDETGYISVRSAYPQDFIDAGAVVPTGDYDIALDFPPINKTKVWGLSSTATWTGDDYTFKSITSYRESDVRQTIDADSTELAVFHIGFDEASKSLTQELQLSNTNPDKLEWMTGFFYLNEDGNGGIDLIFSNPTINIPERNITNAYAVFGQMTYEVTERMRATFGLRYSYESKSYDFTVGVNGTQVDSGSPIDNWSAWTPRFALDYDISEDVMAYVSATKGFKSGGFQLGDAQPFDQEILWSYEAGVKSTLLDNRLRANVGVFLYDYTNLQVVEFNDDTGIATTTNAGKATIQGIEGEFIARVTDDFDLNATISYMDAVFDVFPQGPNSDFSGNNLPNAPKLNYSVGAQYTMRASDYGYVVFRGDYAWRDNVNFKSSNLPRFRSDTYSLINARISFLTLDDLWEFSLYGSNLTDNRYATYITSARSVDGGVSNITNVVYGEPRQFGLRVRRNF